MIFQRQRGIGYAQPTDLIGRLYVHSLRSYEWRFKMQKMVVVVFVVVQGYSRSSAMSPFDRAHTTSYSVVKVVMCSRGGSASEA